MTNDILNMSESKAKSLKYIFFIEGLKFIQK